MNFPLLQILAITLAMLMVLGSSGCADSEPEELSAISSTVEIPAQSTEQESGDAAEAPLAETEPAKQDLESIEEQPEEALVANYEPPYPERINIFEAPQRQGRAMMQNSGDDRSTVELLGFVDVDGPRVVLSIDGLVASIAEGDQQDDIQVISIHPPAVVLQRGRQRWQATLEN